MEFWLAAYREAWSAEFKASLPQKQNPYQDSTRQNSAAKFQTPNLISQNSKRQILRRKIPCVFFKRLNFVSKFYALKFRTAAPQSPIANA